MLIIFNLALHLREKNSNPKTIVHKIILNRGCEEFKG
jgi:hypothetical protein